MSSGDFVRILYASEAEAYIQQLESFDLPQVGSARWRNQHEYLEKLNMQAVANASQLEDEYVKEYFISYEKMQCLVWDLIVTDLWKERIFPEFDSLRLNTDLLFPVYIILYHEATVINLLETLLYHRDACTALDEVCVDLIDYCTQKLTQLIADCMLEDGSVYVEDVRSAESSSNVSSMQELKTLARGLRFDICMKIISVVRYFTDHLASIPLSAATRMLNVYDTPSLLAQLIELAPWTRRDKNGKQLVYTDSKWVEVNPENSGQLCKLEAQIWLSLYQLLLSETGQNKYEINTFRKSNLLKLRIQMRGRLLSELPVLSDLLRFLEQLAVSEPPAPKRDFILEQMPEMRQDLVKRHEKNWKKIAQEQNKNFFNDDSDDMRQLARKLADTYSSEVLEGLMAEPPKCAVCGQLAVKRCSRCQNEWYCRRECQVKHWPRHKKPCDLLCDSVAKLQETEVKAT